MLRIKSAAKYLFWLAVVLILVGAAGAAWSAGELTNGISEIPRHWWSSAPTAALFVGLALLAALASTGERANDG
ncbi:MAG: hypothetical protein M3198_17140 [Actinomycetota bacterium]|nr:hypothetical protein [Actinomycetota bacterium]